VLVELRRPEFFVLHLSHPLDPAGHRYDPPGRADVTAGGPRCRLG
jgi:hypothetical protein